MPLAQRPDVTLTPAAVLKQWLPQRFGEVGHALPPDCPKLRVTIRGALPPADVMLVASERQLEVQDASSSSDPDIWIRLSAEDFHSLLHGDPNLPALVPPERDLIDLIVVDMGDFDRFAQMSGRIAIEILGGKRRRFCVDIAFGPAGFAAGRAKSTVSIDGPALQAVLEGSKPPLAALLEGRIKLQGDRALAMQAMMLMATRTTRR